MYSMFVGFFTPFVFLYEYGLQIGMTPEFSTWQPKVWMCSSSSSSHTKEFIIGACIANLSPSAHAIGHMHSWNWCMHSLNR